MKYEEMTEKDKEIMLMNVYVKSLTTTLDAIVMTHSFLLGGNDLQKTNKIAHNMADNVLANFVCNYLKTKSNEKVKGAIRKNFDECIKRLNEWCEAFGNDGEEEKKNEVH